MSDTLYALTSPRSISLSNNHGTARQRDWRHDMNIPGALTHWLRCSALLLIAILLVPSLVCFSDDRLNSTDNRSSPVSNLTAHLIDQWMPEQAFRRGGQGQGPSALWNSSSPKRDSARKDILASLQASATMLDANLPYILAAHMEPHGGDDGLVKAAEAKIARLRKSIGDACSDIQQSLAMHRSDQLKAHDGTTGLDAETAELRRILQQLLRIEHGLLRTLLCLVEDGRQRHSHEDLCEWFWEELGRYLFVVDGGDVQENRSSFESWWRLLQLNASVKGYGGTATA